jgi:hypothetical protein
MIRLTVLYNLPPGADEEAFLEWRLTEHQEANASTPGVIRTDFARIDGAYPDSVQAPYRFMTTADWPDRETFAKVFYAAEFQATLQENIKKIHEPLFLISEILIEDKPGEG